MIVAREVDRNATQFTHMFDRGYGQLYWRLLLLDSNQVWSSTQINSFRLDAQAPTSTISGVNVSEQGEYTILVSANDDVSGVESYNLQFRQQGEARWRSVAAVRSEPTATIWLNTNFSYEFRVMARDKVGNVEAEKLSADIFVPAQTTPTDTPTLIPTPTDTPSPTPYPSTEIITTPIPPVTEPPSIDSGQYIYYFPFMAKQ